MHIDWYERNWIIVSVVVLILLFGATLYSAYGLGIHVETDVGQIEPAAIASTVPFNNPGLVDKGNGNYEAVVIAEAWRFIPNEIRVPIGSTVTFKMTSRDVIHGFKIPRTVVNRMVIPGQITEVTYTFTEVGRFPFFCHEYCGAGHHVMDGVIIVEPS